MSQGGTQIKRSQGSTYGEADGWEILCAADAAFVVDGDDGDIIDGWLATMPAGEFEVILSYLLT